MPLSETSSTTKRLNKTKKVQSREDVMKAVEDTICDLIQSRRAVGLKKYGIGVTERSDLSTHEWIQHAIEEALDFAIYLEKIKRELADRLEDEDFTPLWKNP